ncbi:MAG: family 78 glycoside hydrolase catalytic domain [Eubacteriales bacterium]|nr:family 78 glycoside hydrolase catalytic domain [Eubacteriales bacterium]MDD3197884.1 family 78 glycoside hydrolase catalytic domain [Eubacteriales bacterium]MDD3503923.1 family 78 glycoside hydrolase catalytic domain [Eubacteriales bacterium]MDD4683034.1 family 78 glycoside hydrolase catalytic domain [Eubacteriales bacterium]
MRLYDLQVNHLKNPLGFKMEETVFSWKVAEAKGQKQSTARVVVAVDEDFREIVADTGFDSNADSLAYAVNVELKPRTRYFWAVTVRSDAGEEQTSEINWFETAKMDEEWAGKWITCDNSEKRHPYFEKKISPAKQVRSARLYISGLGLYEAYYQEDGSESCTRLGDEYLTPYSNDYNEWVQYQTFDMTEHLKQQGTLSILLGNGWYKARFGFSSFDDVGFYGSEWKLIAELRIVYEDGSEEVIGTDPSFTVRRSNIVFSNLYDGEHRDDTLPELPITAAELCEAPAGKLTARLSLPVTIHERIRPVELIHTPAGETVLDLGQIFAGIFSLCISEPAGTKIRIQTGEILQGGNFYNENLRTAKSEYIYISDGSEQTLIPHFTYYGYRFVKIEGITNLKPEDFVGLALYSDFEDRGFMTTGHELVNKLISNIRWGLKGNFLDVPTDCPQRDERMGWTGDTQVFSPSATYLVDTYAFYKKYLYDMAQEQKALDGKVPDVVPSCGVESTACVWGDAACIIPWNLYQFYGDKNILADQFESMKSWVDYVRRVDGDNHGWRYVFHYGDWLALDNMNGNPEQVLGATDEEFIANVYYAASAELVAKAAEVLGLTAEVEKYRAISQEQFDIVKKEYYSSTGRCCIKTQTALLLTLKYNLSDNRELTIRQLKKLFEKTGNKLETGFVGTPLLCNVLTENGMSELAYELLLNEDYPGWLREVKLGATTVWERWNSVLDDGSISGTGMNSLNHYAYGSVIEWMFKHAAGIQIDSQEPGCRRINFKPLLNWDIRKIAAEYDSPAGLYKIHWEMNDPAQVSLSVSVPFGCEATIELPMAATETYNDSANPMLNDIRNGVCHLQPGEYSINYKTIESLKKSYSTNTPIQELLAKAQTRAILEKTFPSNNIPAQYMAYSMRDLAEKFGGRVSSEQLDKLDQALAEV